ncbi:tetratricopeptide repeat protein [Streptomyces sp. ME19-01-6]|uniref:tetratricopeptide repeat protein n=1 Tax=Streptomyces sp. ME19-01-6 TaxID=3028686 RepID=UPI0029BBFCCD|nr:tetratricopeptide repeat protein [Streptomyces sp. ME19-01-6]MDX3231089.1 tetratricopeptide repeat protein [Streptomyces sp. ME19-01-6]
MNNLPTPDSAVFRGRDEALAVLMALPAAGAGVVAQSVRGLGGVGKSTLALQHARRFLAAGGGPVWWVDAESASKVTAGLAAMATALNPVHAGLPVDEAAQWAVVWLQGRTGWLLVLDNAEDPADLDPYLGRLTTGQVVITTRRDLPWRDLGTPLRLNTLTPEAAVDVLRDITGSTDAAGLDRLADELGNLPLALQQAGAYLAQTRTPPGDYLAQLRQDPAGALAASAPGDPQQRTIAQLWSVTLNAVQTADPHAVDLLRILAYCAPGPLPRNVLDTALETRRTVDHALGVLAAYSMITLTETTVTVHRLVQTVIRATTPPTTPTLPPRGIRRLLPRRTPSAPPHPSSTALALLRAAIPSASPEDVETWPAWQTLLPHIQAVVSYDEIDDGHPDLAFVLGESTFHLWARGQATQALPLAERALTITEAVLGPNHPNTATRLNNLAATLSDLGRHTEALSLKERALTITEATLGPNHPDTALRLNNLAATLSDLGRHTEALSLEERALAITETALGPNHPDTAIRLGNLAATLSRLGRHADALPLAEQALAITETTLGPNHPDTARCLNNLATTLSRLGRHADALPLKQQALAITEAALGLDHPDTALRLGNLAATLSDLGRPTDAMPLEEQALAITETTLGPNHPDTALRLGNLAATLSRLGRPTDAMPLEEQALAITETTLGPNHPDTARCLNNLATTLSRLGRHADAIPLAERAVAIIESTLGPDHHITARHLDNLAILRRRLADDGGDDASD